MTYNVLIVDDEPDICELMATFLGMCSDDIETYTAENGKAAFEMYAQLASDGARPDIVLMDIRMPVMDGIEATRRILESDPDAKVYMVTAYFESNLIEEAMNAGAKDVINKTIGFKEITDMVREILGS